MKTANRTRLAALEEPVRRPQRVLFRVIRPEGPEPAPEGWEDPDVRRITFRIIRPEEPDA